MNGKTQKSKSSSQIKSRERVANHGEVFTAEREVKAMCDLVKDETERIDSRFLEPACGNGNFLAEILSRKLSAVESKYKKDKAALEKYSLLAVSSCKKTFVLETRSRSKKLTKTKTTRKSQSFFANGVFWATR